MAFVLDDSSTYFWPISLQVPVDGGKYKRCDFEVEFQRIPQSELLELIAAQQEGALRDVEIIKKIMVGWKNVTDSEDQEVPFTATNRDQLLEVVGMASAIGEVFFESRAKAKRKN